MSAEVKAREIEEYRQRRGKSKTEFWRKNKAAIIAQGQDEERRAKRKK